MKKKSKKSGGFQSFDLLPNLLKGVLHKGYRIPTPIQRRAIPVILAGYDVVAMARTGSGKTCAFLVPLLQRLQEHSTLGTRALILAPTRELALQTLKFTRQLAKHLNLTVSVILGGEKLQAQFAVMHEKPDIIVATPGRLLHILVEMDTRLDLVEFCVFDEADRLFEMGFQEQLTEILNRLPPADRRQTVLFSATLPSSLVDFAQAGLQNPQLIRLDVESSLSQNLLIAHISCRAVDKPAALMHLLKSIVPQLSVCSQLDGADGSQNQHQDMQCIVFLPTKHHVEYFLLLLQSADISCAGIYSAMDPTARKIALAKFQRHRVNVLLVTDLAARGIDIPRLDCIISYCFPPKAKLFVHRVGRVARAGHPGVAINLVAPDELPYLLDTHLFIGRSLKVADSTTAKHSPSTLNLLQDQTNSGDDSLIGRLDQTLLDVQEDVVRTLHERLLDLQTSSRVCDNAMRQYCRSRPLPSGESVARAKQLCAAPIGDTGVAPGELTSLREVGLHPWLNDSGPASSVNDAALLIDLPQVAVLSDHPTTSGKTGLLPSAISSWKPKSTIFEINKKSSDTRAGQVMASKRKRDQAIIDRRRQLGENKSRALEDEAAFADEIEDVDKERRGTAKKSTPQINRDFFVPYRPSDFQRERQLAVRDDGFARIARASALDLMSDDRPTGAKRSQTPKMVWDRKKKKFVRFGAEEKAGKIRTESGAWISRSYKSDLYNQWLKQSKALMGGSHNKNDADGDDGDSDGDRSSRGGAARPVGKFARAGASKSGRGRNGRPTVDEILKKRKVASRKQALMKKKLSRSHQRGRGRSVKHRR